MAGKAKNLLGKRFGRWTVINRQQNKKTRAAWLVVCDCGNQKVVTGQCLSNGSSRSCGCIPRGPHASTRTDLLGQRFGKLVVLKKYVGGACLVQCDCGATKNVLGSNLRLGFIKSCGCIMGRRERGSVDYPPGGGIYFLQEPVANRIKIGRAISFKSRLNSIQSSNVEILKVVATMPGGLAEERSLHARFQSTRIRGEWFGPSPELLELIEANRWNGRRHAA
jgi:hypothetical protein